MEESFLVNVVKVDLHEAKRYSLSVSLCSSPQGQERVEPITILTLDAGTSSRVSKRPVFGRSDFAFPVPDPGLCDLDALAFLGLSVQFEVGGLESTGSALAISIHY
ncbi:hypothetical protein KIPB_011022 [Kipferlia bialata]|uniref:Uncharacterized protein n=1 Tax=Kipferlia bialata TaxID=797122 RepID=A0A9K3D4Z5_9EUKA|nr:hypothetical protein KIPB_011022 [Kipferlia bialata]|eukprot:g11022.t1